MENNINKNKGFKDTPIFNLEDEALGLKEYADALLEFVLHCDTPMTIALQGDWGSGKTSLMNLIRSGIPKERNHIIWFNTWQYSQFAFEDTLAFSMLSHFISQLTKDTKTQKTLNLLRQTGKFAFGVAAKTLASTTGIDIKSGVEAISSEEELDPAKNLSDLKKQLQDLVASLKDIDRIILFIDDLDRLIPIRAVELLESLKLFLDIEKCVYIIAVDYHIVVQGLKEKFGIGEAELKGKSFFDKIIQVPFNMPVSQYDVKDYFRRLLDRLEIDHKDGDLSQYIELVNYSVGFNPRSMKRIFNSLLLLQIVAAKKGIFEVTKAAEPSEVSKILFGILCMQHSYPQLYRFLTSGQIDISDKLFKDLTDDEKLLEMHKGADFDSKVEPNESSHYYQRMGTFMGKFYDVLQLKADVSDKAGQRLSPEEIKNLKIILSFSVVVSTDTSSAPLQKKLSREDFIGSLPEKDKPFFTTVLEFLDEKEIEPTMGVRGFSIPNSAGKAIAMCYPSSTIRPSQILKKYLSQEQEHKAKGFLKEHGIGKYTFHIGDISGKDFCDLIGQLL